MLSITKTRISLAGFSCGPAYHDDKCLARRVLLWACRVLLWACLSRRHASRSQGPPASLPEVSAVDYVIDEWLNPLEERHTVWYLSHISCVSSPGPWEITQTTGALNSRDCCTNPLHVDGEGRKTDVHLHPYTCRLTGRCASLSINKQVARLLRPATLLALQRFTSQSTGRKMRPNTRPASKPTSSPAPKTNGSASSRHTLLSQPLWHSPPAS